jgi:hypothetical protein
VGVPSTVTGSGTGMYLLMWYTADPTGQPSTIYRAYFIIIIIRKDVTAKIT